MDRRGPRPRVRRAFRVDGPDDLRAAARIPRADSDSALPEPRERGDRQHALPDGLFEVRRFGGRTDRRAAFHARADRGDEGARIRLRGGDAPCRGGHVPARQGRGRRAASDAHRAFRGAPCDGGPPAGEVGAYHRRGNHLGAYSGIACGPCVAHPHGRDARCRAGRGAVGAVRHSRGVFGPRGVAGVVGVYGARGARPAESLDADHDRTGL